MPRTAELGSSGVLNAISDRRLFHLAKVGVAGSNPVVRSTQKAQVRALFVAIGTLSGLGHGHRMVTSSETRGWRAARPPRAACRA